MSLPGVFTISLDFELHWGCFENMLLDEGQQKYFRNTIEAIPKMLDLFSGNNIHVTWATVGMLYREDKAAWMNNKPRLLPTFTNPNVSAYEWIAQNGFYSDKDPFHFAPELIELIKKTPNQEIGTHTYAHYFCLEKGQTPEQFKVDIEMACRLALQNGTEIRSLVFPRNQFNHAYLGICADAGITSIRSSPDIWYWAPATGSTFMKKLFRAGDAYLKFQSIKMVYLKDIRTDQGLPLWLPATRLYRPWKPGQPLQNKLKMRRILNEMTEAAKKKAYYHLWWHPHNFGNNPRECLHELKQIVDHYTMLNKIYGVRSMTMGETAQMLLNKKN
ncbi:MAG: polysaccharide deacetylase family protein [Ginsengibacter sp.]